MTAKTHLKFNPHIFLEERSELFDAAYWQARDAIEGQEKGRGTTWFVKHGHQSLVLRHYYRGGLIGKFNRDRYAFLNLKSTRSFQEFEVLNHLHRQGLPVPEPAGARVIQHRTSYQADIITRRIEGARDLVQILQTPTDQHTISKIATMVATFHLAGVYHTDLNIQNILIDQAHKVWLIDFDQAQLNHHSKRLQQRMLNRLKRSFEKEKVRHNIQWQAQDWSYFMDAYSKAMASPFTPISSPSHKRQ